MTETEARRILTPPLKFGDEKQIAAVHFLENVHLCAEAIRRCSHGGFGARRWTDLQDLCGCFNCFSDDEIQAAHAKLRLHP